ncbi:hypothetical protein, partial [Marinitenerispora sediminis]|uniref:hypothetical protein n=1 Tax=Marinitenerispora sediminis TaxID=1931232 RepID=UPI001C6A326A
MISDMTSPLSPGAGGCWPVGECCGVGTGGRWVAGRCSGSGTSRWRFSRSGGEDSSDAGVGRGAG